MTEQQPYREGDEKEPTAVETSEENSEAEATPEEEPAGIPLSRRPLTAFLVIAYADGGIDAVTDLPEFEKDREATVRDIRDMTHALHLDVVTTMNAQAASATFSRTMKQAVERQAQERIRAQIAAKIKT